MTVNPWYVGATHVPLSATCLDDSGAAVDLTNATLTARITIQSGTNTTTVLAGAGTFTTVSATAGTFTYKFASADLPVAGSYQVQFKAAYPDTSFVLFDTVPFNVLAAV